MLVICAIALLLLALGLPLLIRSSAIPPEEPPSPTQHLEDRKAAIYENLRDLQAEYHMGKLSDEDYQQTKVDLQKELAAVLAEIEAVSQGQKSPGEASPGEAEASAASSS